MIKFANSQDPRDIGNIEYAYSLMAKDAGIEKAYALACFNVLAHNRDDHAKNFSFLLDDSNSWVFAPAYDLTFSDGPAGEQSTMVMGEGKNPGVEHLKALGKEHNLKNAPRILAKVQKAVWRWKDHAAEAGVSAKSAHRIPGKWGSI
jgi:serine/threonine-protein kinase HipA